MSVGSSFDSFLESQGIKEEVHAAALNELRGWLEKRVAELLERAEMAERAADEWQRVAIASQKTAIEAHEELLAVTRPRCANTADMFDDGDAGC